MMNNGTIIMHLIIISIILYLGVLNVDAKVTFLRPAVPNLDNFKTSASSLLYNPGPLASLL